MVGISCALFLVGTASLVFRIAFFIRPVLSRPMFVVSLLSYASSFVVRTELGMHLDNRDVVFRSCHCLRGCSVAICFRLFVVFRSGLFFVGVVRMFRKAFCRSRSW